MFYPACRVFPAILQTGAWHPSAERCLSADAARAEARNREEET